MANRCSTRKIYFLCVSRDDETLSHLNPTVTRNGPFLIGQYWVKLSICIPANTVYIKCFQMIHNSFKYWIHSYPPSFLSQMTSVVNLTSHTLPSNYNLHPLIQNAQRIYQPACILEIHVSAFPASIIPPLPSFWLPASSAVCNEYVAAVFHLVVSSCPSTCNHHDRGRWKEARMATVWIADFFFKRRKQKQDVRKFKLYYINLVLTALCMLGHMICHLHCWEEYSVHHRKKGASNCDSMSFLCVFNIL